MFRDAELWPHNPNLTLQKALTKVFGIILAGFFSGFLFFWRFLKEHIPRTAIQWLPFFWPFWFGFCFWGFLPFFGLLWLVSDFHSRTVCTCALWSYQDDILDVSNFSTSLIFKLFNGFLCRGISMTLMSCLSVTFYIPYAIALSFLFCHHRYP